MKCALQSGFRVLAGRIFTFLALVSFSGIIFFLGFTSVKLVLWAVRTNEDREEALLFWAGALVLIVLAGLLTIVLWKNLCNCLARRNDDG
jgi:glucan phosphoethanolaminetransferase (alkaline phosphatase superfamily)